MKGKRNIDHNYNKEAAIWITDEGEKCVLLHNIMQGRIQVKRNTGRRPISWFTTWENGTTSSIELYRAAASKVRMPRKNDC